MENQKKGNLYIIATPIGNLEDITLRAIRILKEVDLIAAEDTRHTLKLLNHLEISKPLISYHRHNEEIRTEELIKELKTGKNIGLVSDAGTPGICDPGEEIIKKCIEESIKVVPIPGACAMINALITSGISTKEFIFLGFLPLNKKSRKEKLEEIKNANKTIILYEAPHKLKNTLNDLSDILQSREVVLARELTKIHEEYIRGTVKELMEKTDNLKGEMILIIEKNNKDNEEELNSLNNLTLEEHYNFYEKRGLNKKEIIKNKIDIAFFTENKKEFKEQCEKMRNIIKFLPKKSRKEITFNMTIKEAIIDKDVKKVNELSQQLEKRKNLLDKIMVQYYKGVVLEKNNKNCENEYKFVAEKGNNLYIAKQAREKLKIEPKDNPYKKKRHVIYKAINIISILIILLYMMSVLIYMKEKPNIKWNTGEVSIFEQKMILPIGVKEFEEKNQIEIKEIDENNFAEVKLGESTILLYIKDEQIKGLKIDLNSISQSDIDKIKFPSNVSLNNSIEEVKETYKTGNVNIFMKKYNEKAIESENIHIDRYIGQKYNIEIRSIGNKIQSILYVYKY